MELVQIQFSKRTILPGGAMYLPGEVASVPPAVAEQFCHDLDPPAATLVTSLDAPPRDKMVKRADHKKEYHG